MVLNQIIDSLQPLSLLLDRIQCILALEFLEDRYPQSFGSPRSLGRVGLLGSLLGILWGAHVTLLCLILVMLTTAEGGAGDLSTHFSSASRNERHQLLSMLWTWCFYVSALCTFHLSEFFVTALYNPTVVSSDSFLINHSKAYTAAAIVASTEFWIRFAWRLIGPFRSSSSSQPAAGRPSSPWPLAVVAAGIVIVTLSQIVRTWSMKTCGESFNHYIQVQKKDNHQLVTTGIYRWLRHPSYVGFYYWSVGTQCVLQNPVSGVLFVMAGWSFFSRRIPYEERSLVHLFGDEYYDYAMRTYVGIPFISSRGLVGPPDEVDEDRGGVTTDSDANALAGEEVQLEKRIGSNSSAIINHEKTC